MAAERVRTVEVTDEREPIADAALALIEQMFKPRDRQPLGELRSEIAERRLGMLSSYNFHLIVALVDGAEDDPAEVAGAIAGLYLDGVNAGFITYLAVRPEHRGHQIARVLRPHLVEVFRADARRAGHDDLAWVLGEVRADNPWLKRLVRTRGAIPFDIDYYHPGMPLHGDDRYVLYRQPVGDHRRELPVGLVRRVLYAIYRRAYRTRYPLQRDVFLHMVRQLEGRTTVGVHRDFLDLLPPAP